MGIVSRISVAKQSKKGDNDLLSGWLSDPLSPNSCYSPASGANGEQVHTHMLG